MHVRIGGTSGGEQWQGYKELFDGVVFAAREERDKSNLESIMTEAVQSEGGAVQRKGVVACASARLLQCYATFPMATVMPRKAATLQVVTIGPILVHETQSDISPSCGQRYTLVPETFKRKSLTA